MSGPALVNALPRVEIEVGEGRAKMTAALWCGFKEDEATISKEGMGNRGYVRKA